MGKTLPPEPLTQDEVVRLMAACGKRSFCGKRNRAIVVTFWRAGLRCAELIDLDRKDVDLDAGTIRILHGKGKKSRTVGIDAQAVTVIAEWIRWRSDYGHSTGPMFCTYKGGRLAPAYLRNLMKHLGRKSVVAKRVHPHGLRHTAFFEMANEGVPLHVIQQIAGHSSLATTDVYIRHLAPTAALDAMRDRRW